MYINKLLKEDSFKKKGRPYVSNDEGLRKNVDDLKKTIAKINQEKEAIGEKFALLEKARQKEVKTCEVYRKELERVNEELEQYRHYVKDNTNMETSFRKKNDIIRLENELRNKNKYIDTLLESIKDLQSKTNNSSVNKSANSNAQRFSSKYDQRNILDSSKNSLKR